MESVSQTLEKSPKSDEGFDAVSPITLSCQGLTYKYAKVRVLKGIDLIAEPGEILAVAGPSGAGKTTLLNCICCRMTSGVIGGEIKINGLQIVTNKMRQSVSYVMTEGRLLPYLTVHETLMAAVALKHPNLDRKAHLERVERVLSELGLEMCRDTHIGGEWKKGISTGERKRVFIAIELLGNPSLLVMDEPTSGLDSSLASELILFIEKLAKAGRTIIISVHQPTSLMWNIFHKTILLAQGQTAYVGPTELAKKYFSHAGYPCPKNYNPADYFLSLLSSRVMEDDDDESSNAKQTSSKDRSTLEGSFTDSQSSNRPTSPVSHILLKFKTSQEAAELRKEIANIKVDDAEETNLKIEPLTNSKAWMNEVNILFKRSFKNSIRNPIVCCVMILVQALQGIILGGIFWQLSSEVQIQQPLLVDTKAIINNPWSQLFIGGIDGRQPLIDALERGVNNKGSQPLTALYNDRDNMLKAYNILSCAYPKQEHFLKDYYQFVNNPSSDSKAKLEDIRLKDLSATLLSLSQVMDFHYRHVPMADKLDFNHQDVALATSFWLDAANERKADLLNPYMVCAGYLPFDLGSRKTERRLITIGDIGLQEALLDMFGSGGRAFGNASTLIFEELRSCDNEACKWINERSIYGEELSQDLYAAVMASLNIVGALFFTVANLGFSSYDALLTFPQERALFNRETASGLYTPSAYFLAKNLADLGFQLVPGLVLTTIFYLMVGLGQKPYQFFVYCLICAGVTFSAYGFGYFVSAASPRMEISVLLAPTILVIWLTVSGFFLRDEQIPSWIRWFGNLSFYKWGFFALVSNQFSAQGTFGILSNKIPLLLAGITEERIWFSVLILLILGFAFRILAFFALKYTNRKVGLGM